MKRNSVIMGLGAIAVAAGCASERPGAIDDDELDDDGARLSGYFIMRRDVSACAGTACGGFWLSPVNGGTARCLDGGVSTRCYTAAVDLTAAGLSPEAEAALEAETDGAADAPRIIVRGSIAPAAAHAHGVFVAREVWRATSATALHGAVMRVSARGAGITMSRVNTPIQEVVTALDVSDTSITDEVLRSAEAAARTDEGVLAVGLRAFGEDAAGRAVPTFHATQFFHRVNDDEDVLPARPAMIPPATVR